MPRLDLKEIIGWSISDNEAICLLIIPMAIKQVQTNEVNSKPREF